jgi:hypothetical protein
MRTMVEEVVSVLDEVGVCPRNDHHYKTIKLNEKRKKRNLTVIDKNTGKPSIFSYGLKGYGTTNRDKDGRVISRPINPDYWKEPEDPVTRYTKGLEKQKKKREKDTYQKNIDYDTDKHNDKVKYRNVDTRYVVKRKTQLKPSKTTGEKDEFEKKKERERKDKKELHPNTSLKWTNNRWMIRRQQKEEIEKNLKSIQEISLRTGFTGGFLLKVKQYGNRVDKGVSKLKSLSSSLNSVKDEKEKNKIQSEITKTDSEVSHSLRKMIMYVGLVSGSGSVGTDRTYKLLKKMEKQIKK